MVVGSSGVGPDDFWRWTWRCPRLGVPMLCVCLPSGKSDGAGRLFGDLVVGGEGGGTAFCIAVSEEFSEDCEGEHGVTILV